MKNIYKKKTLKIDLKILLLNFHFAMIYIIYKMLVLLKNDPNYLKDNSFISIIDFYFLKKLIFL